MTESPKSRRRFQKTATAAVFAILAYLSIAYFIAPSIWDRVEKRHPSMDGFPRITRTGSDIPGDPLNVALIGTEKEVKKSIIAAKWYPADPLTLKSCLEIAEASVLSRPYDAAPVSSLYLFGRKEDLAFERPVGDNPRHRHHVRFWKSDLSDSDGRPVWVGSAVYDERVGISRTTGQVTHVTAPDVDAERAKLFGDLEQVGVLAEFYFIDGFHKQLEGKNGGGDPWRTDGRLEVGVIRVGK